MISEYENGQDPRTFLARRIISKLEPHYLKCKKLLDIDWRSWQCRYFGLRLDRNFPIYLCLRKGVFTFSKKCGIRYHKREF